MEASRWLISILIVSMIVMTRAEVWRKTPGDLHVCEGQIAEFPWSYRASNDVKVLSTYWFHMTNGATIMEAINGSYNFGAGYVGRVFMYPPDTSLPDKNVGFDLHKVTVDDSGLYRVQVIGKTRNMTSDGKLTVYKRSMMKPVISYGGSKTSNNITIDHRCCKPFAMNVNLTGKANITVTSQEDGINWYTSNIMCNLTCDVTLLFNHSGNYSVTLTFKYPACETVINLPRHVNVYEDPVTSDSSSMARIIAVSVIAAVVVIAVLVTVTVVCIRRHRPTTKPHQETDTETAHLSETIELTDGTYTEMVDFNIKEAPSSDPNQVDAEPAEEATEESQLNLTNVVTELGSDIVDNYFSPPEGSSVDGTPIVISRQESKISLCNNNNTNPDIYPHYSNAKSKVTVEESSSTDSNVEDVDEYGINIAKGI